MALQVRTVVSTSRRSNDQQVTIAPRTWSRRLSKKTPPASSGHASSPAISPSWLAGQQAWAESRVQDEGGPRGPG